MAQPHKGPRRQTNMRLPAPVYDAIKSQAAGAGIYTNECAADLLSLITGHLDHVAKLPDVHATATALIAVLEPVAARGPLPRQLDLRCATAPQREKPTTPRVAAVHPRPGM